MDILQANYLIDNELNADDREFIRRAMDGIPFQEGSGDVADTDPEADRKRFERLESLGLVQLLPLSHPRVNWGVKAVALTEDGNKVFNALQENPEVQHGKEFITETATERKPLKRTPDKPNYDDNPTEEPIEATVGGKVPPKPSPKQVANANKETTKIDPAKTGGAPASGEDRK